MKLTVEENSETIKRYAHIEPAPRVGGTRCGVRCPGAPRRCTRQEGHRGPHVSHGWFGGVLAVWDGKGVASRPAERESEDAPSRLPARKRPAVPTQPLAPPRAWDASTASSLVRVLWKQAVRTVPPPEEAFLFVFFLGMVAAAIHWVILLLG